MGTLIRYELKKLLCSKVLWAVLVLVLAFTAYNMKAPLERKLNGYVQGLRDACAPFEGQMLTDAVANQARVLLLRYAQEHPDDFQYYEDPESDEVPLPSPKDWNSYAAGLGWGFIRIAQGETVEKKQASAAILQRYLDSGSYDDGRPLTEADRQRNLREIENRSRPLMVRYADGWEDLYDKTQSEGLFIFVLLVVGLTALFGAERSTHMDNVLLSAKARRWVIGAKMLVSAVYALALCTLLFGLQFVSAAFIYGLQGGQHSIRELGLYLNIAPFSLQDSALPVSNFYLPALALTALAAVSCTWFIALASSLFRNPLATLGAALAVLAVQFLPVALAQTDLDILAAWITGADSTILQKIAVLLPAYQLNSLSNVAALTGSGVAMALCTTLSALLAVAAAIATPAVFCRRRKV